MGSDGEGLGGGCRMTKDKMKHASLELAAWIAAAFVYYFIAKLAFVAVMTMIE